MPAKLAGHHGRPPIHFPSYPGFANVIQPSDTVGRTDADQGLTTKEGTLATGVGNSADHAVTRRLTAVLAADVVGYSRLMAGVT